MTSSMITGERRWASARRGGMTVLGKVAVPKPINLPSQRLENHGLDPNVEIVPKGTLSWGNRPSSAGSNAWGTSALSPSTDGGSSSPSHLVGRPSSGGGTRPSTAGSDRAHDSNASAWASNSRPSSASGVLGSNHASLTSLRPRSAETRPGSSHLSRFAESSPDGAGALGPTATSERMGVATSANEGFSLSSGDFPTLGSEKDESRRNMEPLDHASHGRPGSSSGGVKTMADSTGMAHGDDVSRMADVRGDSWRKEGPPYVEDGPRPSIERWHGEPPIYQNSNMGPPLYESWCGAPPVNPPGGVWFRGPPGPPPYGGPVPPGGFPMEPFPYYRPQVPAPGLSNSQPIPPPGAGHHGHHPKNGDMYRPHMPESYMRPGMAMRPGFYPGPVPYDGYYRPPMGFCNPNERDLPFMGVPAGPPVYNRHANQNAPDLNNSHPRSHEGRAADQIDPGHLHDSRGNYKVLVKPNDGWIQNDEEKWAHRVTTSGSNREKGILSKASAPESPWGYEFKKDEDIHNRKTASIEEAPPESFENKFGSPEPANLKLPGAAGNVDQADINPVRDNVASRDHSLIQKIQGLNAKARASGGRQDGFHGEEPNDRVQIVNAKAHVPANEATDIVLERHYPTGVLVPVTRDSDVVAVDKSRDSSVTAAPRRVVRGAQSRGTPYGKGRPNGQEADGWGKKFESHSVPEASFGSTTNDQVKEHHAAIQPHEVPKSNVERNDGESMMSAFDPSDTQRAKMREIAKQRAIQLQKEEEERIREQKAKALAKLEELNRRSANQGMEVSTQKEIVPPHNTVSQKQDDSRHQPEPSLDANPSAGSSSSSFSSIAQINDSKTLDSAVTSRHMGSETKRKAYQDSVSSQNQMPTTDVNVDDDAVHRTAPQVREVSKQKRVGYKQRQNVPLEKNSSRDSIPVCRTDKLIDNKGANPTQEVTGGEVDSGARKDLAESLFISDSPAPQKKRNNKSGKNKHKVEEPLTAASLTVPLPLDSNLPQAIPDSVEQNASYLPVSSSPVELSTSAKDAVRASENHLLSREDTPGRANNAWKPQHSRKARNSQGNRSSEKTNINDAVVWAPVRSHNKVEVNDQTSQKAPEPLVSSATGDCTSNNGTKTKRAEMERYVPKPVAKELAQQGSIHQSPSPPVDQAATDGTGGRENASQGSESAVKAGSAVEPKHAEGKNRHAKNQGSWRQRISAESITTQTSQDTFSSANTGKNIQPSNGLQQTVKSYESVVREIPSRPDEHSVKGSQASVSDGWDSANDSSSNPSAAFIGAKDHFPSGRGKRLPFKGQKGSGNNQNIDHNYSKSDSAELQFPVETNQTEKTMSLGDRSASHWQPKSQGYVGHNQQGNRSRGSLNYIAEDSTALKRETGPGGGARLRSQNNQYAAKVSLPASEGKTVGEARPEMGHQETKRDKRTASFKGHPQSSIHGPAAEVEPASFEATDGRNEQRPSSGHRKSSNYSDRFNRGHESRGDWSTAAQDNKQHHSSSNRERQRQNSHYEYQPVGPYNSNDDSRPQTENQPGGPRFRERGNNQSRRGRGNFYGRQS